MWVQCIQRKRYDYYWNTEHNPGAGPDEHLSPYDYDHFDDHHH